RPGKVGFGGMVNRAPGAPGRRPHTPAPETRGQPLRAGLPCKRAAPAGRETPSPDPVSGGGGPDENGRTKPPGTGRHCPTRRRALRPRVPVALGGVAPPGAPGPRGPDHNPLAPAGHPRPARSGAPPPAGAVARLGTVRYRVIYASLGRRSLSHDGRLLAAAWL